MDEVKLLNSLNWFLMLEKGQVEFYHNLSKITTSEELAHGLQRFKKVEEEHVHLITAKINSLDKSPSKLSSALGAMVGAGAPVFGKAIGGISNLTGIKNMLKAGYLTEKRAIKDYKKFIETIEDQEIRDMLWNNLIDEESHYLWLLHKSEELERYKSHH